jgi:hypothetical protein
LIDPLLAFFLDAIGEDNTEVGLEIAALNVDEPHLLRLVVVITPAIVV